MKKEKKVTAKKTIRFNTFTDHGAATMAKFYRDKLGCDIVEMPTPLKDGSNRFTFVVTDPFQ